MASMTFTRASDGKQLNMDSSPQYSLPKAFGWVPGSVECRRVGGDADHNTYDVYAKLNPDSSAVKLGVLVQQTTDAIWRRYK